MFIKKAIQLVLLSSILLASTLVQVMAADYVVIVNQKNSVSGDSSALKNQVKQLFLKEKKKWSNSIACKPLSAKNTSDSYKVFVANVLSMDDASLAQHWLRAKQKTGDTPPRSVSSTRSIIKLVARNEGAFGFIPKADSQSLNSDVKILFEF